LKQNYVIQEKLKFTSFAKRESLATQDNKKCRAQKPDIFCFQKHSKTLQHINYKLQDVAAYKP